MSQNYPHKTRKNTVTRWITPSSAEYNGKEYLARYVYVRDLSSKNKDILATLCKLINPDTRRVVATGWALVHPGESPSRRTVSIASEQFDETGNPISGTYKAKKITGGAQIAYERAVEALNSEDGAGVPLATLLNYSGRDFISKLSYALFYGHLAENAYVRGVDLGPKIPTYTAEKFPENV